MSLTNKVAIITGAASGIGLAIARDLAGRGASIVIGDMRGSAEAAESLNKLGFAAAGVQVDVSDERNVTELVAAAEAHFGGVDILVNNAGIFSSLTPKPFEDISLEETRKLFEINVFALLTCCRIALPSLVKRGGGRIVNISSGVAFRGNPMMAHYVASKGAVVSLTRSLASELGGRDILVNSVAPGFTLSDGVNSNPGLINGIKANSLRSRVLARDMVPNDIVGAVAFFAGPDSSFITGQTLVVDGGSYFH